MGEKEILFWIFIVIFSITAIITLLGITGVIKTIKERHLNVLFTSLILEVVVAVVALFNATSFWGTNTNQASMINYNYLLEEVGLDTMNDEKTAKRIVHEKLRKPTSTPTSTNNNVDSIMAVLTTAQAELNACRGDLNEINRSFFTKTLRLRKKLIEYDGFINLGFKIEEKKEIYKLLATIFDELQLGKNENTFYNLDKTVNTDAVRHQYTMLKKQYRQEEDERKYMYIFQNDILQMIRLYLKMIDNQ